MIKLTRTKYFMLYASCRPVKGAKRSVICDLQKNSFIYIPNAIFDLLKKENNIIDLKKINNDQIEGALEFLVQENMGFYTTSPDNFPEINLFSNDYPEVIKNVIIDFNKNSKYDLREIVKQISTLRCSAIELRFFDKISESVLIKQLSYFKNSTIRTIYVLIKYSSWLTEEKIKKLCVSFKRLKQIVIFGAAENSTISLDIFTNLIYIKEDIKDAHHCGNISPFYFRSNIDFFRESIAVNNCLDKKIGIDVEGNIKNCPSMRKVFGNIHNDNFNLLKIIKTNDFRKFWTVKKDDVDVCKDCEFRYICLDCRAYLSDPNNIYSKPQKCNYDPYNNIWL